MNPSLGRSGVSTHSRPKAAGLCIIKNEPSPISFNTQPPEGGWRRHEICLPVKKSFNTQPPEGGWQRHLNQHFRQVLFQHTAARRRLERLPTTLHLSRMFQHTAARRRLVELGYPPHSSNTCFNTQPPEGGWPDRFRYHPL